MVSGVLWSLMPTSPFTTSSRPRRASTASPIVVIRAGSSTSVRTDPSGRTTDTVPCVTEPTRNRFASGSYATPSGCSRGADPVTRSGQCPAPSPDASPNDVHNPVATSIVMPSNAALIFIPMASTPATAAGTGRRVGYFRTR